MTKEMRPSHRIDVLTHAILHYAEKTTAKIRYVFTSISLHLCEISTGNLLFEQKEV